ncbi:type II CRISPR-associated endonuclease Cas1 [Hyphococcus lacteus]|uniref:Type II CRISPR-associated endonuclease Cas1 n=1 Tax=Hyphococcus lacteus TaxID=3143536 RepID=A0ABV3Z6Y4_9PROT
MNSRKSPRDTKADKRLFQAVVLVVRSGDPDNYEAQAARKYWPRIMAEMDEHFKRDSASAGLNGWLNYGYAVLRAGAARSILSAGLHPSLSVHHESRGEALRLASDIMEPFRPWVDLTVRRRALRQMENLSDLNRDNKAAIIEVLNLDLRTAHGASPVQSCLNRLCQSFARICLGEQSKLYLPDGLLFNPTGGGE